MFDNQTLNQGLYAYLINLDSAEISCYEGEKNSNGFYFPGTGLALHLHLIHHEFVQFDLSEEFLNHSIGRFGLSIGKPQLCGMIGISQEPGATGLLAECAIIISRIPLSPEERFRMLGIEHPDAVDKQQVKDVIRVNSRIDGFLELSDYCAVDGYLTESARRLAQQTTVFGEGFFSGRKPEKRGRVSFEENLTLVTAKRFVEQGGGKVAVLNFANPVEPGGGVLRGADAQEEYLCRSSDLYQSLISANAAPYYTVNKAILNGNQFNSMFLGTDRVIYSPAVTVLKEEKGYIRGRLGNIAEKYAENGYWLDVISCAAPFFSGSGYILPNGDLKYLLKRRIRNIMEVAIENETDVLILGAFGCGAFHNPTETVAEAFRECLLEPRYANAFDEVVFAVKREAEPSVNITVFERFFSTFPVLNENGPELKRKIRL